VLKKGRGHVTSDASRCAQRIFYKGRMDIVPHSSVQRKIYNATGKENKCSFIQPFITRTLVCRVADVADEALRVPSSAHHVKQMTTWVGVLWRPF
jgi:hypothetical protein